MRSCLCFPFLPPPQEPMRFKCGHRFMWLLCSPIHPHTHVDNDFMLVPYTLCAKLRHSCVVVMKWSGKHMGHTTESKHLTSSSNGFGTTITSPGWVEKAKRHDMCRRGPCCFGCWFSNGVTREDHTWWFGDDLSNGFLYAKLIHKASSNIWGAVGCVVKSTC